MFNCWRPSKLQGDQNGICITRLEANIPTDPKMPRPIATGMLVHAGQPSLITPHCWYMVLDTESNTISQMASSPSGLANLLAPPCKNRTP
ncbi:hypothetical protein VNO77_26020 [Canavalia gladiata]|uniref:Uncharacterized protein n=1 Tax=Canavalia gladiata TaxID=3824 RepID=A0AAN9KTJ0_CANGL